MFVLFWLGVFASNGYFQSLGYPQEISEDLYPTTYVKSYEELITELEKRTIGTSVFFVSYDEVGHIIHSVPILIPNLIAFLNKHLCEMPPFCVVLFPQEALRKVE